MREVGRVVVMAAVLLGMPLSSFSAPQEAKAAASPAKDAVEGRQYSGTYTFLKEGEYLQITVEEGGQLTGFISRFDDRGNPSDKSGFVDQFIKTGKLHDVQLNFTTKPLHDLWFEFKGTVERGAGKDRGDEGYYVLKGTLTENTTAPDKKVTSHAQEVTFKMFPQEADSAPKN